MGSGRVASHLAPALVAGGWRCTTVCSRTAEHASALADRLGAQWTTDRTLFYEELQGDDAPDLLLLVVTDDALREVAQELPEGLPMTVLHTSGSTPMSVLERCPSYGVLYPLQTFSLERAIDMSRVPLFVEGSGSQAMEMIDRIAKSLGTEVVREVGSEERTRLHVAACFACNFVNHMYALAGDVLEGSPIRLSDLGPLMEETLSKAIATEDPAAMQTGPAVRHDESTLERHRQLLRGMGDRQLIDLYDLVTRSIQERAKKDMKQ